MEPKLHSCIHSDPHGTHLSFVSCHDFERKVLIARGGGRCIIFFSSLLAVCVKAAHAAMMATYCVYQYLLAETLPTVGRLGIITYHYHYHYHYD